MTPVAIVVAVVVLLLVRGRGTAQLQGPAPGARAPEPTRAAPREEKKEGEKAPPPTAPRPSRPEAEEAKPSARRPPAPAESIEVTVGESQPPQAAAPPSARAVKRDVAGLRKGLAATRGGFIARLTALFQGKKEIDPAILEQVEEVMLASDVGPKTTQAILGRLRESLE